MNIEKIVADKSDFRQDPGMVGIGKRAKSIREEQGLSQQDVADRGGINVETVNRAEHDQNITLKKLYGLALGLGVGIGSLIPETSSRPVSIQPSQDHWSELFPDESHRAMHRKLQAILESGSECIGMLSSALEWIYERVRGPELTQGERGNKKAG